MDRREQFDFLALEQDNMQDWLKGFTRAVRLVHQVFTNKDVSTGTLHLVCSDLMCDYDAITTTYKHRIASGGVSQILDVQCGNGQVANTSRAIPKQLRFHDDLCRLQTRMLERERQDQLLCFKVQTSHQCHPQRLRPASAVQGGCATSVKKVTHQVCHLIAI